MPKQIQQSTNGGAFINAILVQARLVNEHVRSAPSAPTKEPKQIQLRIDTSSGFSVALDNTARPNHFIVEIDYKLSLKTQETEKQLLDYEAKHSVQFDVTAWSGFDDWIDMPNGVMAPYFAVIQNFAIRRAEGTLVEMGLRGINLPVSPVDKAVTTEAKGDVTTSQSK